MRVMCDIDGVLYKFANTYRYMMNLYRGYELPPVNDFWHHWNAPDEYTSSEDRRWIWSEGIERGLFRHGHCYKGAIEGVQRLAEVGDVVIITSRPKAAVQDTMEWLAYNRFPISEVHILGDSRPKSSVLPHCDVYIDDSLTNVAELLKNTRGTVLLWSQPWNESGSLKGIDEYEGTRFEIVRDWKRVAEVVNNGGRL